MAVNSRENSTSYVHPQESNLLNIHKAMEYNSLGQPIVRFSQSTAEGTTGGVDAFGRFIVSTPYELFDSQHRYAENTKWFTVNTGSASTTYDVNSSTVTMDVTTASGDKCVRETKRVFPYQPGKALEIINTFQMEAGATNLCMRVGYFDDENGIFLENNDGVISWVLRSKSSGSVVETRVAQANWNTDTLDGDGDASNPSGQTLDLTKSQIQFLDIEWLGVGTVRCGFIINGTFVVTHKFHHANVGDKTYMTTATLPIRYEIEAKDTLAAGASLVQSCSAVTSYGGYEPSATGNVVGRGLTYYTMASVGTFYHLVSIRLDAARLNDVVLPSDISVLTDSNLKVQYKLVTGATFSNPLTFTNATDSVEFSTTDSAVTSQGEELATRYVVNFGNQQPFTERELHELQLERDNSGAIVLSLIATADSPNAKTVGNITFQQPLRG